MTFDQDHKTVDTPTASPRIDLAEQTPAGPGSILPTQHIIDQVLEARFARIQTAEGHYYAHSVEVVANPSPSLFLVMIPEIYFLRSDGSPRKGRIHTYQVSLIYPEGLGLVFVHAPAF